VSRRPRSRGRLASFFVVLGCLTVLGVAFVLGMVAGRHWPGLLPTVGARSAVARERETSHPEPRPSERKSTETIPPLTFYKELTAPLTPRAPGPRPRLATKPPAPDPGGTATRYTVQVGAFGARAPAEALRDRLSAAGYDSYVDETEAAAARWRVRVGDYASREDARRAAQRLGVERQLATYVTTR
jgi:cell division protein FtsN